MGPRSKPFFANLFSIENLIRNLGSLDGAVIGYRLGSDYSFTKHLHITTYKLVNIFLL